MPLDSTHESTSRNLSTSFRGDLLLLLADKLEQVDEDKFNLASWFQILDYDKMSSGNRMRTRVANVGSCVEPPPVLRDGPPRFQKLLRSDSNLE